MSDEGQAAAEMPRYKSHKEVWALRIKDIQVPVLGATEESDGSLLIIPEDPGYRPVKIDADYIRKHEPQVGGYYVVYKDGYKSWSPAEAFEEGYTRVN